ncbi:PBS lyase HEAT domain-containing protein [Halovivax asiaticus JCM 14624]|uniref:PBS lyase HEAT domain-containing protein n=1 Tax=Halovivax asiaticus JCM 14624 TaxID=1227490 RepID=M0BP22_9EURY|nr:HEAT repeat domain-containing protein [Halovivax asiaticus]ELZ12636.1 PBS lyase HEAT domain-containing protein [Halovivax asiaticus JCM 14624]
MSDGDDADDESADDAAPVGEFESALAAVSERVDELEAALEAAETEPDLDAVEADLADVREEYEAIDEIPEPPEEPDDEDEEPPEDPYEDVRDDHDELGDALDDVESGIEDQRGPYGEDVRDELSSARSDIDSTRWTAEGVDDLRTVVATARAEIVETLGADEAAIEPVDESAFDASDGEPAADDAAEADRPAADDPGARRAAIDDRIDAAIDGLVATLDDADEAVEAAGLDADDDAATIATLLEIADDLQSGVDDATAWDDLEVREQLRREGFYDVLDHVKDFPPEWHALKVHQRQENVEMILLALESLDSDYMEKHCFEALERLADPAAIDTMVQKANRRDENAIAVLGAIGEPDDAAVDTLLDYVDTGDVAMRTTTMRALGQLGTDEAVQPIANQLADDDETIRSRAARSLGLIGDTRAIAPLADVLADDESDTVRASAAWALRQIGTEDALAEVTPYADDRVYLVQAEAQRAQ